MNIFLGLVFIIILIIGLKHHLEQEKLTTKQKKKTINKMQLNEGFWDKWHYYILGLLFFVGLVVRVYKFGIVPGGFNQDGAMAAVDALSLATYGTDRFGMQLPVHFTAWGYGQMSVLMSYFMVPFIKLFGLNSIVSRLPMLCVSLISLWVVYAFVKKAIDKNAALVALLICVINPWQIIQSRWALDANMLPHFMLFSVYLLYLGLEKQKYLYISMLFFALTMYTYGIAFYAVPLFLFLLCVYLLATKQISISKVLISMCVYLFFAWPILAVMIINTFKLHTIYTPIFTIPFFKDTMRSNDLVIFSPDISKQLAENFKSFWNVVILQKPDLPWNTINEYGTMYLFSLPLLVFGIFYCIKKIKNTAFSIVLIWFTVGVLSGLMVNGVNVNRINIVFYPIFIMLAIAIYYTAKNFKHSLLIFTLVYAISFCGFTGNYFTKQNDIISRYFFDGFGQAIQYVDKNTNYDKMYVTDNSQAKGYWTVSEILTMYHEKTDARYFQGKKTLYSKDGKELLPYKQRYNYIDITKKEVNYNENAVYVINNEEKKYFDKNKCDIVEFKYFSAVIPKGLRTMK